VMNSSKQHREDKRSLMLNSTLTVISTLTLLIMKELR